MTKVQEYTHNLIMSYDYIESHPYIDETGYLTYAMMLSEYNMLDNAVPNEIILAWDWQSIKDECFLELYSYYKGIFSDIRYFPIPLMGKDAMEFLMRTAGMPEEAMEVTESMRVRILWQ